MSARTEQLLEEIRKAQTILAQFEQAGNEAAATQLRTTIAQLQRELATSNEALTESRQILKG